MNIRASYLIPIVGVIALLALYTAYWFFAQSSIQREVGDWIEDQESAGYAVAFDELRVIGFPYRFQIEVTNPDIRAPQGDGGWHARFPALQANALPYDFSHWIVEFTGPAIIEAPTTTVLVGAGDQLSVDDHGNYLIRIAAGGAA